MPLQMRMGLTIPRYTGSTLDAAGGGGNPLDAYGSAAFLFDVARAMYRNGASQVGDFASLSGLTFTRASTGYAQTSAGVLTSFGSGVPRITDKGILIEGAGTNLCLQSQTFQNAVWDDGAPNNATVATDLTAPDGTATGQTLTAATGTTLSMRRQALTTVGSTSYIFSVFIKQGTATSSRIRVRDMTNGVDVLQATAVTWSGGTPTTGGTTGTWGTPIQLAGGWWRIWGLATTGVGGVSCSIAIYPDNASGTGTLGVWGAQLEAAAFPSSYIPTTSSSATRAADVASIAVSGISYPATLFAEFEPSVISGAEQGILCADKSGGATDIAYIFQATSGAGTGFIYAAGATQMSAAGAAFSASNTYKLGMRVAANDGRYCQGGTLATLDNSVTLPNSPDRVILGQRYNLGGLQAFGYLKRAAIWSNLALTDAQLQAVTS